MTGRKRHQFFIQSKWISLLNHHIILIHQCSFLIWLGDLNYRINLTEPEIKSRLERKQVAKLMDYDQVNEKEDKVRAYQY